MIGKLVEHSDENENDNPFAFTDKYKTDIPLVDDEHRHLLYNRADQWPYSWKTSPW